MQALDLFPWPTPPGASRPPQWNGQNFEINGQTSRVLIYQANDSHWSDDLTSLHETEAGCDHPIDMASRQLAVDSIRNLKRDGKVNILDVGCSSGFVLENLQTALPEANLIGADYLRGPLEGLAQRMPSLPLLQFDLRQCPLPAACVDGITCLNVLEHIDDDAAAMHHLHRILKPKGVLHLEVPAGPKLFDIYDEHLLHHRRYRLKELIQLAQQAGFQVKRATHLGFFVYPAFWWVKQNNRRKLTWPKIEKTKLVVNQIRNSKKNFFLDWTVRLEAILGRMINFPIGIRCVVVLTKR